MLVLEKLWTIHHSMVPVRYYLWKARYGRIILLAVSFFWSDGAFFHGHVAFFTFFFNLKGKWRTSCKVENFPWGSSNLITYSPLVGCPRPFVNKPQKGRKNSVREKVFNTDSYDVHIRQVVKSPYWRNF